MELGELARTLVDENRYCVLATASQDGKPEAATIQYASDGFVLYFETMTTYRKYPNLVSNPQASVVITQVPHTLQMDGIVRELKGVDEDDARTRLVMKLTEIPMFYSEPNIRFFKFMPTLIRFLDKGWPPKYEIIR